MEYISVFDAKYRKIEKKEMKLPPEILAFKLLRRANISKEETMIVLTGMNYDEKATLYEQAKSSLKKFKGEVCDSGTSHSSGPSIKLEPAFLLRMSKPCSQLGMYEIMLIVLDFLAVDVVVVVEPMIA